MLRDLDCFQIPYEISVFGDKVIKRISEYDETTCDRYSGIVPGQGGGVYRMGDQLGNRSGSTVRIYSGVRW